MQGEGVSPDLENHPTVDEAQGTVQAQAKALE